MNAGRRWWGTLAALVLLTGMFLCAASVATGEQDSGRSKTHAVVLYGGDATRTSLSEAALQGAFVRNAQRMEDVLSERLGIDRVSLFFAREMTVAEYEASVNSFIVEVGEEDVLLFYYTGHGIEGAMQAMFLTSRDVTGEEGTDDPSFEHYPYHRLRELLVNSACRTIVIIDACHSGSAIEELQGDPTWTIVTSVRADQRGLLAGVYGSAFNVEFVAEIRRGHTRVDEILRHMHTQYGEEPQLWGDGSVDLASECDCVTPTVSPDDFGWGSAH